jgi:hypothetical protein
MNIEITIRDITHIQQIIHDLVALDPKQVNLTDKTGLTDNLLLIEAIRETLPNTHFVPHYSFKNHTSKNPDHITENFKVFIDGACNQGISEVLLVSGSPKPKIEAITGLAFAETLLAEHKEHDHTKFNFAVAYNPFLEGTKLEVEKTRLSQKLLNPRVSRVYLQMGSLTHPLRTGIEYVRSLSPNLTVTPSVIIPSKNFLTKFRFRPWKGVILDDKYLANLKNAEHKTHELIKICKDMQAEPLLEMVGFNNFELDQFKTEYHELYSED